MFSPVIGPGAGALLALPLQLGAATVAKTPAGAHAVTQVLFTLLTVAGSWLLVGVLFTLSYASLYWRDAGPGEPGQGLLFPGTDGAAFKPDYVDFLYFSFTIAVAAQTADVAVTTRPMRKLVLQQALLSFVFNATLLALTVNIAAGLF